MSRLDGMDYGELRVILGRLARMLASLVSAAADAGLTVFRVDASKPSHDVIAGVSEQIEAQALGNGLSRGATSAADPGSTGG